MSTAFLFGVIGAAALLAVLALFAVCSRTSDEEPYTRRLLREAEADLAVRPRVGKPLPRPQRKR